MTGGKQWLLADRTVFVIENVKTPGYCSLFKLGLSKTKTQLANVI